MQHLEAHEQELLKQELDIPVPWIMWIIPWTSAMVFPFFP
jgi:hypothetical protein